MNKNALLITILSFGIAVPCCAVAIKDLPQLSVNGAASIFKPADQITFTVGVYTENADVEEALKANTTKMETVIAALKNSGLTKDEYQTGSFTVFPVYSSPPKDPDSDWRAVITGYRVQNELSIKTTQLDHAGQIIDAVNKAGADVINDIGFSLKDKDTAQAEAINAAAANALLNAKTLSESAHTPLKRVLKVSLDQVGPMSHGGYRGKMMLSAENATTPIEPAQIEVNANISLTYEIE